MTHRMSIIVVLFIFAIGARAAILPPDIKWETNTAEPPIGDPQAIKGGTLNTSVDDYPLTFRLMGPNSNDAFASWNRAYTMDFALVVRHPVTDRYIPWMATHWAVMNDHKTVYYQLDPAARWSDGRPVTADDYVFTFEMMGSKEIVDPNYNNYVKDYLLNVEAIDAHTLKITGKRPSWRPLDDYGLFPMPRHATHLGPDWVKEANNVPPVTVGPYVITAAESGKRIVFEKIKNWWGEDKGYFKGLYNVNTIVIRVIPSERALDYFKNGEIDLFPVATARIWAEDTGFSAIQNGWAHKKIVFVDNPNGIYGLAMNLQAPIFQNKDFRKALQYLFDFNTLNKNLMYHSYYRQVSAFTGTEYANPELKPYGFDPRQAHAHLIKAGYTQRGSDGILLNDKGEPARLTLIYGSKGIEPHLTLLQQIYRHAGIDLQLKLLEGATAFNRALERKYEMTLVSYTAGFYPEPYEYFDSVFLKTTNNNNIWGFGTPETDKLIDIYRFNMDKKARREAMFKLDAIIQDEAFYIPFWTAPYVRLIYSDKLCWPSFILPKRTQSPETDWQVYWIDPAKEKRLNEAKAANQPLTPDTVIDVDAYGVKK